MSNTVAYDLKHPIERRGKDGEIIDTITRFELQRPKGKHLKATDKVQGDAAKTLALIAAAAGQPASVMDELDIEDFTELGKIVEGFTGVPPQTGVTSSAT